MQLTRRRHLIAAMSAIALAAFGLPVQAADWPTQKPITYVVPFTVGGSTDVVGRMLAQKLAERL